MAAAPTTAVVAEGPTLADFFDHVAYSNPFAQDRISDPAEADVDVEIIHHRQFNTLVRHAVAAQRDGRGMGVVLWGEAGVGKSHLLARFTRWAEKDDRACYVFLHNIHVHSDRLPRYVLKAVISRLVSGRRRGFRNSPLYHLLLGAVKESIRRYSKDPKSEHSVNDARRCFEQLIGECTRQKTAMAAVDDPTIYKVLFDFFYATYQAERGEGDESTACLAVRWLSGDALDPEEASQLGVKAEDGQLLAALPDNQAIQRVLLAMIELCRLRSKPFILIFDQVENLAPEEVQSLARFCHTLLDQATNLLVITSGVQKELLESKQLIGDASWERIAQDELMLQLVQRTEAERLLQARLEKFFEPFLSVASIKPMLSDGELFPLGEGWLEEQIGDALEMKPRHVIGWARKRWNDQIASLERSGGDEWLKRWSQTVAAPPDSRAPEEVTDEKVNEKIREQVRRRELDPSGLPPDASNLCGLVEALLLQCQDAGHEYTFLDLTHPPGRKTQKPTYDLLVRERDPHGNEVATGVAFVVTGSKTSATGYLRRISKDPNPPEHVLVVCDEREPLECGKTGKEHLEQLTARGPERFQVVHLPFLQYAQLDALEAVIGEARSGDLEVMLPEGMQQLSEEDVIDSHHRQDRYRRHPLLHELLCEETLPPVPPPLTPPEPEIRQFIAAQLALTMGMSSVELAQKYHAKYAGDGRVAVEVIKIRLEQVALEMHHDERLNATPMGDYLYLLNRPGR